MTTKKRVLSSRYELVNEIKTGGMGTIYEALDTRLNARVAVKENLCEQKSRRASFRREAQVLANLNHPSLPQVIDHFFEKGRQYLVMQFIPGDDLAAIITREKQPFAITAVLELALQLLDVISYLHGTPTPILHRDIKPANLKLRNGQVVLLDFGLAFGRAGEMSTLKKNSFDWEGHSHNYSGPEQLRGDPTTRSSDLYSFSATLYVLLTAVVPTKASHRLDATLAGKPDPLKDLVELRPDLDRKVAHAIMRGLSLEPEKRPQTCDEMRLEMFSDPVGQPTEKSDRRFSTAGMSGAVLLTATICLAVPIGRNAICSNPGHTSMKRVIRCQAGPEPLTALPELPREVQLRDLRAAAEDLLQHNNYEGAINKCLKILALFPNDPVATYLYGDALLDSRSEMVERFADDPEVQRLADRLLEILRNPVTPEELTARSWAYLVKGKKAQAITEATRALVGNPKPLSALMIRATAKGMNASSTQSLHEAISDYDRITSLNPNYVAGWANRAAVLSTLGEHENAIVSFDNAIKLTPKASFYVGRAHSLRSLRKNDIAARAYRDALNVHPDYYRAYEGLGDMAFENRRWAESIKYYGLAINSRPTIRSLYGRGYAYSQLEKVSDAINDLTEAMKLGGNDYRSQGMRAYCYAKIMEWGKAVDDYRNALKAAPADDRAFRGFADTGLSQAQRQRDKMASTSIQKKARSLAD